MQMQQGALPPMPAGTPKSGGLGNVLGMIALLVAIVALALNLVLPGPAGPRGTDGTNGLAGATGPHGPPGPGSLMFNATGTGNTVIAATCTNYASISITVPGAGKVIVTASLRWSIDHTAGTLDAPRGFLGTTAADCTADEYRVFVIVAASSATGTYFDTMVVFEPFTIATAGTYVYYANADSGSGADAIYGAGFTAVFYPN